MNRLTDNLHEINCYHLLSGEEYLALAFFHFFKLQSRKVNVFSEEIKLYEELIEEYNVFMRQESKKVLFLSYVLGFDRSYIEMYIDYYNKEPWKYSKPILWKDRSKGEYYINQLTESHRFELYVDFLFRKKGFDIGLYYGKEEQYSGESKVGIEIKNDKESLNTGNLYIEYEERLTDHATWAKSGILKKDNTIYWAIGNYNHLFFIKKSVLIGLMNQQYTGIRVRHVSARRGTSKGYIISIWDAGKIADSIETVIRNVSK